MAHAKQSADSSESSVSDKAPEEKNTTQEQHIGWAGVHVTCLQEENNVDNNFKKLILLDSGSNATVFCENNYVTKIWDTNKYMGVGTNGGGKIISTKKYTIPHLGDHWFNDDPITNIIVLSNKTNKCRVTMDSNIDKILFVHLTDKIVKFRQLYNNLYGMNPADSESYISKDKFESNNKIHLMNVVGDNVKYMSERQQQRAKIREHYFKRVVHSCNKTSKP